MNGLRQAQYLLRSAEEAAQQDQAGIVRTALEKLKAENKNLMAIIWALVIGQGGQACINQRTILEAFDKRNELVTWDDPVSCSTFVKARRFQYVQAHERPGNEDTP